MADGEDTKPTLEESLGATFDAIQARETTERTSAAAEVAEPEAVADAAPGDAPEGETAEEKADRLRAEDGKFRKPTRTEKKAAKAAADPAKAATVAGEAAKPGAAAEIPDPATGQKPASPPTKTDQPLTGLAGVNPPAGWSAAAKAAFSTLPPAVQAAVSRRETEVTQGFAAYEGIGKALAPVQQALQMRGVPPAQYIAQMVQIDQALSNPATRAQTFDYLARTYGYQPAQTQAGQQQGASNPATQVSADPTIAALQQQLSLVTNHLTQQQHAQRAVHAQELEHTQRQANSDVEAFRNDPKNEFFDLVREDIRGVYERAAVLNQPYMTLAQAYEQAVWANAQTRPVMLARQAQKTEDDRAKASADAAAKARKAGSGNIRSVGGSAPNRRTGPLDLEAEMAEVYDKVNAA